MTLPIAILAGGMATRLGRLTATIPKSLLDIAGEPFVFHQLRYLRSQGIEQVVLCVGHLGEQVELRVGDGRKFGLRVSYSYDGPRPRGTAGAVKRALPLLGERFFLCYGDSFLPVNFSDVEHAFFKAAKPALMTVLRNANRWDTSNAEFRDGQVIEYNKAHPRPTMEYIDYGLSVLSANVFAGLPEGEASDLADVFHELSLRGDLAGYEVSQRFYEIGSEAGLAETRELLSNVTAR